MTGINYAIFKYVSPRLYASLRKGSYFTRVGSNYLRRGAKYSNYSLGTFGTALKWSSITRKSQRHHSLSKSKKLEGFISPCQI